MKLAIMQPYFLPYIGYFQLIASVDQFIVYDNIKYTKKGWVNRNRMLVNGREATFSLPLKSASDVLNICSRELASDFSRNKMLNQFRGAYLKAPYFDETYLLLERIIQNQDENLFLYLYGSLKKISQHLGLNAKISISSEYSIDHNLRGQDKVLALCEVTGAKTYVNAVGGVDLYEKDLFLKRGIELKFIRSKIFEYPQFGNVFVPWLSIIDVMMFNHIETIKKDILHNCEFF